MADRLISLIVLLPILLYFLSPYDWRSRRSLAIMLNGAACLLCLLMLGMTGHIPRNPVYFALLTNSMIAPLVLCAANVVGLIRTMQPRYAALGILASIALTIHGISAWQNSHSHLPDSYVISILAIALYTLIAITGYLITFVNPTPTSNPSP